MTETSGIEAGAERHAHQSTIDRLLLWDSFYAPMHEEMLAWLNVPAGSRVLDAGCGAGGVTALLAAAVGVSGRVTALDTSREALATTREVVTQAGHAERLTVREGSIAALPFPDESFDLVWCSRAAHGLPDQLAGVRELRRVLRPGGRLALREGGIGIRFLPLDPGVGLPGLEERLSALHQRWFWQWRASMPDSVAYPHGWSRMLADGGCRDVSARAFLLERQPPFSEEHGAYLLEQLRGRLEHAAIGAWLTAEDRDAIERLTDPDGPDCALRRDDLHALAVSSVYVGATS